MIDKISSVLTAAILIISPLFSQETGARYLIITRDDYYSALQPLAHWKTQKGFKAKIVKLSETGSDSTQIRDYIINAYDTWSIKPEYLLLVGNKYQLPWPRFMHPGSVISYSDNYYANVTGDFHNELYHGRLWVSDTLQVQTIVAKVLGYEKNPFVTDSLWFRKGVTIVNEYEPGQPSSESLYWADARYAHQFMTDAGFAHIDSLSYLRGDSSIDVVNAINNGRSYILYRGTGVGYWETPFNNITPNQMNNGFKLPIVLSATCATIEGIGEDWTNAGTPEQPKGMIGFYGTTTALFAAAEMRSVLCRATTANIFSDSGSSLGKAAEAGRLAYNAQFGDLIEYHGWTCLGDPELRIWTGTPKEINVTHNMFFSTGVCTVDVYVQHNAQPVDRALVCVMAKQDSAFYSWGYTDDLGHVQFIDTLHIPADSVYITVTGRNLKAYSNTQPVNYVGGPFVQLHYFRLLDSLGGNCDHIANPGEDIEIPFCLKNMGDSTAHAVFASIEEAYEDSFYSLYDTIKYVGDIAAQESIYINPDAFNLVIDADCPDLYPIELSLQIADSTGSIWMSNIGCIVHSPSIVYHDSYFTGGVKYTPAGDTGQLTVELLNIGSYQAENVIGTLSCSDSFVNVLDSVASFAVIPSGSTGSNQSDPFVLTTDPDTPPCYAAVVTLEVASGVYTASYDFTIYVGQKDYTIWDPDPNHSSGPVIDGLLTALGFDGIYTVDFPYGLLSIHKTLFVCTGVCPNTYLIRDTSQAGQEIDYYLQLQGGKCYIEGGDVWCAPISSYGYDFGPLFAIAPLSNTIGQFSGVHGCTGTFTQNMAFDYQGENLLLDHIDATGGGQLIFKKTGSDSGCGVAAGHKTVGLSFELSGLADTIAPSTKLALVDSIMGYFGILPTGVTESQAPGLPSAISLTCHPNPFRHIIYIGCKIQDTGYTEELRNSNIEMRKHTLEIYDVTGRLVKSLNHESRIMDLESLVIWDGTDLLGRVVPQGVYFVSLNTTHTRITTKIILLR
jgi:hypothetical protein